MRNYFDLVSSHYCSAWDSRPVVRLWELGPIEELNPDFRVLEFPPGYNRKMWTYATCCMSYLQDDFPIELHLFSAVQDLGLVELLYAIVHYHQMKAKLYLNHTVNFGRSWQNNSICTYGFISHSYLDEPSFERLCMDNKNISFYWLIPITESELRYKQINGIQALEVEFEKKGLDYLNAGRRAVV